MDANLAYYISKVKTEIDPIEQAKLLRYLHQEKHILIKHLSALLSMTASYICNMLRLLNLPEIIIDGYYAKSVSKTHLLIISRVKDESAVVSLYEKVLGKSLNVLQTEMLVREYLYGIKSEGERIGPIDREKIKNFFTKIDSRIDTDITQTRIKASIILTIKGSLIQTSNVLKKLADGKLVRNKE